MRLSRILMGLAVGGLMAQSASAQFPGGDGGRGERGMRGMGGPPGMGGGMMMGGRPDPEMIWNFMGGQGKDSINLNDPANQRIKDRMMQRGQAIPANGILTKTEFKANMERSMASGGMGGPPGMGGGTMTMSGTPGAMTMSVNGGPPQPMSMGGPGGSMSPEMIKSFMSRSDTDGDGRISMAEAQNSRGSLRENFTQYDTNRDGFIDVTEYTVYLQNRMGGGMNSGMSSGMSPGAQPWNSQQAPGGWNNSSPPPGFSGSFDRGRERKKEEEPEKVTVYRYGNMPKELPSWFTDYDRDRDGQIGLYEWRTNGKSLSDFNDLDLNGDGFVTADEWLRKQALDLAKREIEDRENGTVSTSSRSNGWNSGGSGGSSRSFGPGGGGPGGPGGGRPNPFTSSGPGGSPSSMRGGPGNSGPGSGDDRRPSRENRMESGSNAKEEKKDRKRGDN